MSAFDSFVSGVLQREKGYVNNPKDRGGETNFGITAETARRNGFTGNMRDLTRDQAILIYKLEYWEKPGFDRIEPISSKIAEKLLDIGVNMGPLKYPGLFLQRCLNVLNREGKDYPDIVVDGVLGPASRSALNAFLTKRKKDGGEDILIGMLQALQSVRYIEIAEANQSQEEFSFGWAKRGLGV